MNTITNVAAHHAQFKRLMLEGMPSEFNSEALERLPLMYPRYQLIVEKLHNITDTMSMFIAENYVGGYLKTLEAVRDCYIQVFEQIVEDRLLRMCYYDNDIGIVLARDYGWNYFKFIKKHIQHRIRLVGPDRADEIILIPRYCNENRSVWDKGGAVYLDADEAKIIEKWDRDSIYDFYDTKKMYHEGRKLDPLSTPDMMVFLRVDDFNTADETLRDWTLPLQAEVQF